MADICKLILKVFSNVGISLVLRGEALNNIYYLLWRRPSVLLRDINNIHYCNKCWLAGYLQYIVWIPSVLWRIINSVERKRKHCAGNIKRGWNAVEVSPMVVNTLLMWCDHLQMNCTETPKVDHVGSFSLCNVLWLWLSLYM